VGIAQREARGPGIDSQVRVMFNPSLKAVNATIPGLIAAILMLSMGSIMSQAVRARAGAGHAGADARHAHHARGVPARQGLAIRAGGDRAVVVHRGSSGRYWFQVPFNGNILTVGVGLGLFMLTSIGIGLLVSLVSRTQQQAQQTIMFIVLPTMVLSGFIFPIESMPAAVVPLTYLIRCATRWWCCAARS